VFGCVRILSSPVATLPFDIKRRLDDKRRADATDHWAYALLRAARTSGRSHISSSG
jgi:phage portal protein BeeE